MTTRQTPLTARRWTRAEYERLVGLGLLEGEPLELIGGQLVVAEPQYPYHASGVSMADYAIRAALPAGWTVRTQAPVSLDEESEPEPDVAVVPGLPRDYRDAHPARPVLVAEVAESSLRLNREHKGSLYARAGIPDFWIVNLVDRVLEVYRDPARDPSGVYGWRYRSLTSLGPSDTIAPLAFPASQISVADLLPSPSRRAPHGTGRQSHAVREPVARPAARRTAKHARDPSASTAVLVARAEGFEPGRRGYSASRLSMAGASNQAGSGTEDRPTANAGTSPSSALP